jgi:hypothetical protein
VAAESVEQPLQIVKSITLMIACQDAEEAACAAI